MALSDTEKLLYDFFKQNGMTFMDVFEPRVIDPTQLKKQAISYGLASLLSGLGAYFIGKQMGGPEVGQYAALTAAGQPVESFSRLLGDVRKQQQQYNQWQAQLKGQMALESERQKMRTASDILTEKERARTAEEIAEREIKKKTRAYYRELLRQGYKKEDARALAEAMAYGYKPPEPKGPGMKYVDIDRMLKTYNQQLLNMEGEEARLAAEEAVASLMPVMGQFGMTPEIVTVKVNGKEKYQIRPGAYTGQPPGGEFYWRKAVLPTEHKKWVDIFKVPALTKGTGKFQWALRLGSGATGDISGGFLGRTLAALPREIAAMFGIKEFAPTAKAWMRMNNLKGEWATAEELATPYYATPDEAKAVDLTVATAINRNPLNPLPELLKARRDWEERLRSGDKKMRWDIAIKYLDAIIEEMKDYTTPSTTLWGEGE